MFGKKKKEQASILESILGKKGHPAFIAAVKSYFEQRHESYTVEEDVIRLQDDSRFGLVNLAQICARAKPDEYHLVIKEHFDTMFQNRAFRESLAFDDFESIEKYLAVRVYDSEYLSAIDVEAVIRRPLAGEVFTVLVFDFPHVIENIKREDADKWGKSEDELFEIGKKNVRDNNQFETAEVNFDEDTLLAVETDHFFAPNILLELEQRPELLGKGGTIVAIPTRSLALIYPIRDMKVVAALTMFFNSVPRIFAAGPGSLTQEVFWYRNGQFESLNYTPGKKTSFTPSEEFLALINGGLEE